MNIKLENMFKARLENELYIDSITIEKIKNIRKNVFNEFKEKINGFQDVNCKIMKGYTAFDIILNYLLNSNLITSKLRRMKSILKLKLIMNISIQNHTTN